MLVPRWSASYFYLCCSEGEDWMSCIGLHLHQLVGCMLTNLHSPQRSCWYQRKDLFVATLQQISNNTFAFRSCLVSLLVLMLLLFFSSSWSHHQGDPRARHVGEPVERGGHQCPHAWQLWCLPCCEAEPTGSYPSSPRFSGPIEAQWLSASRFCRNGRIWRNKFCVGSGWQLSTMERSLQHVLKDRDAFELRFLDNA